MINLQEIGYKPDVEEIGEVINNPLFSELCDAMESEYKALRSVEFSKDVWFPGWNIKFRKAGKSLCAIYPKEGFFTVLVVVGKKEKEKVEEKLPELSNEIQAIYRKTKEGNGQRWLMVDLNTNRAVYRDVLTLIRIRRQSK